MEIRCGPQQQLHTSKNGHVEYHSASRTRLRGPFGVNSLSHVDTAHANTHEAWGINGPAQTLALQARHTKATSHHIAHTHLSNTRIRSFIRPSHDQSCVHYVFQAKYTP